MLLYPPTGDSQYASADRYTHEGAEIWLHGRKKSLGGRRPIDLLCEGEFDEVLDAIERMNAAAM